MAKRVHCGVNSVPPEKMPVMPASRSELPRFFQFHGQRLQQLGRGEHALDVVAGAQNRDRLIDAVLLVRFEVLRPALLDELDDPPRIEIDAEADAAAILSQVLDRQPQPPRTRGAQHQPVGALGEILFRQRRGKQLVVGAEVVDRDPALGNARGAARFEHVDRLVGKRLGHPPPHRSAAQPFVLERLEFLQVVERADLFQRIELQLRGVFQPKRAAGRLVKVPLHGLIGMRVQGLARLLHGGVAGDGSLLGGTHENSSKVG